MLGNRGAASVQEKYVLLNCRRLPGRLNTTETALLLGLKEHDIAPLIAAKLLVPLGKPAQNGPKYFATIDVLGRCEDRKWLSEATKAVARHWQQKNERKQLTAGCVDDI